MAHNLSLHSRFPKLNHPLYTTVCQGLRPGTSTLLSLANTLFLQPDSSCRPIAILQTCNMHAWLLIVARKYLQSLWLVQRKLHMQTLGRLSADAPIASTHSYTKGVSFRSLHETSETEGKTFLAGMYARTCMRSKWKSLTKYAKQVSPSAQPSPTNPNNTVA